MRKGNGKGVSRTRLTFEHPDKHYRNTSQKGGLCT